MTDRITTKRLTLARYTPGDAEALAREINHLDITRWLTNVPFPYSLGDAETFIGRVHQGNEAQFGIWQEGALIGGISTQNGLGYWLAKRAWRQGYATEAARAVVNAYFDAGHEWLGSGYVISNARSRHVLTKLRFRDTEVTQALIPALGQPRALQKMELTRDVWEAAA